jgi:hypothetical protein
MPTALMSARATASITYLTEGGEAGVDFSGAPSALRAEWIHPTEGTITPAEPIVAGQRRTLKAPLRGPAVLFLRKP